MRGPARRPKRRLPMPVGASFRRLRQFLAARFAEAREYQPPMRTNAPFRGRLPLIHGLAQLLLKVSIKEITRMFEKLFGIHEQALLLHGQRIGVLATNIANADTPNYKARDIDFSEVLAQSGGGPLSMQVTQAAHITIPPGETPAGDLKYRNPYQASLDGNTVEMPVEQAAFAENNVRYQASLRFISGAIAEMQLAIAGQ